MKEQVLTCKCGKQFIFTARDQEFYKKMGYQPPKRCMRCRVEKKQSYKNAEGRLLMNKLQDGQKVTLQ